MASPLLRLPLDLATFRELREEGYLYVDKTQHAYKLLTTGRKFFLSRPRRFGKSLFVSTLYDILQGNRDLFKGLWIDSSDYQWRPHGVIVFNFSSFKIQNETDLEKAIKNLLDKTARFYELNIVAPEEDPTLYLHYVVEALHKRFNRIAVLIDEYDHPILQDLHNHENARKIRKVLQQFFAAIKSLDNLIKFVFVTGVSSFTKATLFSGMNDLRIISLEEPYADICGYTDAEIDLYFTDYIKAWADKKNMPYTEQRELIKQWYNGYRFSSLSTTVYSPFSAMYAMERQKIENFWFSTATPTFLVEELKRQQREEPATFEKLVQDEPVELSHGSLSAFDIGATPLPALMFQTGYLTISEYNTTTNSYSLSYPNREVEQSLKLYLLSIITEANSNYTETRSFALSAALARQDVPAAIDIIETIFEHVPYHIHGKDEKYYHAALQMAFTLAGLAAYSEVATSRGRADLIIDMTNVTYVIEVKFKESAAQALAQIEERKYYKRYLPNKKPIILLGISFTRENSEFNIDYKYHVIAAK